MFIVWMYRFLLHISIIRLFLHIQIASSLYFNEFPWIFIQKFLVTRTTLGFILLNCMRQYLIFRLNNLLSWTCLINLFAGLTSLTVQNDPVDNIVILRYILSPHPVAAWFDNRVLDASKSIFLSWLMVSQDPFQFDFRSSYSHFVVFSIYSLWIRCIGSFCFFVLVL